MSIRNDLQNAEKQLQQGLAAAPDDNLKSVINMRLARVQLQLKKPDEALKTLDGIKGEGWVAIVADLRGEICLTKAISKALARPGKLA
ncbi:Mlr7403 protein [Raoultella ornithinolytica]|nr:Mlr7403 protein [Raoultella ornithinolytica]